MANISTHLTLLLPEGHICPDRLCHRDIYVHVLIYASFSSLMKFFKNKKIKKCNMFLQWLSNVMIITTWLHISNDVIVWHVTSQTLSSPVSWHMKCNTEKHMAARGLNIFCSDNKHYALDSKKGKQIKSGKVDPEWTCIRANRY